MTPWEKPVAKSTITIFCLQCEKQILNTWPSSPLVGQLTAEVTLCDFYPVTPARWNLSNAQHLDKELCMTANFSQDF